MSYTNYANSNFNSTKIPYDDIPISRKQNSGKKFDRSSFGFKVFIAVVAVLFIANIILCFTTFYAIKHSVIKEVKVYENNITATGDTSSLASSTAWFSSVCVAAGYGQPSATEISTDAFYGGTSSRGSGVIFKTDKTNNLIYFITCYHVIQNYESSVYIMFPSKLKAQKASVVGYSKDLDIAVLSMENTDNCEGCLQLQQYDTAYLSLGEQVYAVGNSLSGGLSVTNGLISRINTLIRVEDNKFYTREIQTSAEINPGNSGGGLFNAEGKFIGLVNAKLNSTQSNGTSIVVTGTAYALPGNFVISVANSIIYNGGNPTSIDLEFDFYHNEDYGREWVEIEIGRYVEKYCVKVGNVPMTSSAFGKLSSGDQVISFSYVDIFGKQHKDVPMYNKYSFDDIKYVVMRGSQIEFKVKTALGDPNNPKTIIVNASDITTAN